MRPAARLARRIGGRSSGAMLIVRRRSRLRASGCANNSRAWAYSSQSIVVIDSICAITSGGAVTR